MIYKWIKIDIEQDIDISEAGIFTIATPRAGCWLSVAKMMLTSYISNLEGHVSEIQLLFGDDEKTGLMNLEGMPLNIDIGEYHEVLSGEVDEALKIKTTCSSVQGYALLSETEG
ncbi:MAG: hypothetical protein M0Q13_00220 [Methanothrix sp.]|jgi:hypothetical protein|nr:hypothetical protein [Methanothrix sp.]